MWPLTPPHQSPTVLGSLGAPEQVCLCGLQRTVLADLRGRAGPAHTAQGNVVSPRGPPSPRPGPTRLRPGPGTSSEELEGVPVVLAVVCTVSPGVNAAWRVGTADPRDPGAPEDPGTPVGGGFRGLGPGPSRLPPKGVGEGEGSADLP